MAIITLAFSVNPTLNAHMKCRSCQSQMVVSRKETSGTTTSSWHSCPLCKQVRLTSEKAPRRSVDVTGGMAHLDEEAAYAAENESQPSMAY